MIQAVEPVSAFIVLADMLANHYQNDAASGDINIVSQESTPLVGRRKFYQPSDGPRHSRYYALDPIEPNRDGTGGPAGR